jgi:hypothetical protein
MLSCTHYLEDNYPIEYAKYSFIYHICGTLGDTTGDGFINNQELLDVISTWASNQYSNQQLLDVISVWVNSP